MRNYFIFPSIRLAKLFDCIFALFISFVENRFLYQMAFLKMNKNGENIANDFDSLILYHYFNVVTRRLNLC